MQLPSPQPWLSHVFVEHYQIVRQILLTCKPVQDLHRLQMLAKLRMNDSVLS